MAYELNARQLDPAMASYLSKEVIPLIEQQYPMLKKFRSMASKQQITQAGAEFITKDKVALGYKAGTAGIAYPQGSLVSFGRYKVAPVIEAYTVKLDGSTYRDFIGGKPEVYETVSNLLATFAEEFYKTEEQFLAGDGSGKLAVVGSGSTTTSIVLSITPDGTHGAGFGAAKLKDALQTGAGVNYDIIDSSAATPLIESFQIANGGITYGASTHSVTPSTTLGAGPTAGYYITHKDSYKNVPFGFDYLIAGGKTGVWQGKYVTGKIEDQSPTLDGGGRVLDNAELDKLMQSHAFRHGMGINSAFRIFASPTLIRNFIKPGWAKVWYQGRPAQHNTGIKEAGYEDSVFEPWPWCDPDMFYAGDVSQIIDAEQWPFGPVQDIDGRMWKQDPSSPTGTDNYYAQFHRAGNRLLKNPKEFIKGKNYDTTGGVTAGNWMSQFV